MAKSNWVTVTPVGRGEDGLTVICDVKVNKRHPGFWLFLLKCLIFPNATAFAKQQ
jgi:hypothetical protein